MAVDGVPEEAAVLVETFRALHVPGRPVLMPYPWDAGSAKLLAWLGFQALATTSSGHAATRGRLDGGVDRAEALAHAAAIVAAVDVPVSADLENGFAAEPSAVFATVEAAVGVGLAGCSIEDSTGDPDAPFYDAARRWHLRVPGSCRRGPPAGGGSLAPALSWPSVPSRR